MNKNFPSRASKQPTTCAGIDRDFDREDSYEQPPGEEERPARKPHLVAAAKAMSGATKCNQDEREHKAKHVELVDAWLRDTTSPFARVVPARMVSADRRVR